MNPILLPLLLALAAPKGASKTPAKPPAHLAKAPEATASASTSIGPLEQAGEVKEIELDDRRARAVYRIHTATTIPSIIEFPEKFVTAPVCGDCASASAPPPPPPGPLFLIQGEANGNILAIKPRLVPGPQADGTTIPASDFVTTVTVRLSTYVLTLQVELTEDKTKADPRVRFVVPNRAQESKYVQDTLATARAQLEADYASRVELAASQLLLRHFLDPHECKPNHARARADDMVLELKELCRYGHRLYARFILENRGRSLFALGDPTLGAGDGKGNFSPLDTRSLLSTQQVEFNQVVDGVAAVELDDPNAHSLSLTILERGGRNRTAELKDFSF